MNIIINIILKKFNEYGKSIIVYSVFNYILCSTWWYFLNTMLVAVYYVSCVPLNVLQCSGLGSQLV